MATAEVAAALAAHAEAWVRAALDRGWPADREARFHLGAAMQIQATLLDPVSPLAPGGIAQRMARCAWALTAAGYGPGTPHELPIELVGALDAGTPEGVLRLIESAQLIALHRP